MILRAQQIVLPCVAFSARARLAAEGGTLTPIELLTLQAVGAGLTDVSALTEALGLGQRPVLDLVYDFWLKGYLLVDTGEARVRLAGDALTAHRDGGLEKLATAENNLEVVPLIQDLVSGAVLPHLGRAQPFGPESAMVPSTRAGLELEHVSRAELLDALQREVERQGRRTGRPMKVQEAWVEPDELLAVGGGDVATAGHRRFLPLLVDIARDEDSGRLRFDVIDGGDVPAPVLAEIERSLSTLSEQLPDQLFFKRLREATEGRPGEVQDETSDDLDRLDQAVADLEGVDPGVVHQRHGQLVSVLQDAVSVVEDRSRSAARVEMLFGAAEHETRIREAILAAEHQLVLANPWLRAEALVSRGVDGEPSWFECLERSLTRGVQVFVLWGIGADSKLDSVVKNALVDLSARYPGRFLVAARPAAVHAKFVVRDASQAIVTSYNFLDPSPRRESVEVGVSVHGERESTAPAVALDLLLWAREAFPDYELSRRMQTLAENLGAVEVTPPGRPAAPGLPHEETLLGGIDAARHVVRHWAQSWAAVARAVRTEAGRHVEGVDLVVDRQHRELLWNGLRHADRRLAILSDRVSADVVTDRFVRAVLSRLNEGVAATMLFRREGASDSSDGPAARLHELSLREKGSFRVVEAKSHAKVLVIDDEATIGSFNFLSYGGDYERGATGRDRAEISVRVRQPEFVETLVKRLDAAFGGAFESLVGLAPAPVSDDELPTRAPAPLVELFRALRSASDKGPALLAWFGSGREPWADIASLEECGLGGDLFERAVGAALARCPDMNAPVARSRRQWLAERRWMAGDFVSSALLFVPGEPSGLGLTRELVDIGSAVMTRTLDLQHPPPIQAATRSGSAALLLLCLIAVLDRGMFELVPTLEATTEALDRPLRDWGTATLAFHRAAHQPLPTDLLHPLAGKKRRAEQAELARAEFAKSLSGAENVGLDFPLAHRTWSRLKSEGHLLHELRRALDRSRPGDLVAYLTRLDREGDTAESLMDAAAAAEADEHNNAITGRRRTAFLNRLNPALASGRAWAAATVTTDRKNVGGHVLHACWNLRRELSGFPSSEAMFDPLSAPIHRLAVLRLAPLFDAEPA